MSLFDKLTEEQKQQIEDYQYKGIAESVLRAIKDPEIVTEGQLTFSTALSIYGIFHEGPFDACKYFDIFDNEDPNQTELKL